MIDPIDRIIYEAIYRKVDGAIDLILKGKTKEGVVQLRHILPSRYRHSFEKPKEGRAP